MLPLRLTPGCSSAALHWKDITLTAYNCFPFPGTAAMLFCAVAIKLLRLFHCLQVDPAAEEARLAQLEAEKRVARAIAEDFLDCSGEFKRQEVRRR